MRRLLHQRGYVLRANRKRLSKKQDPDRDWQMRYLIRKRRARQKAGFPAVSINAKQRELIGNFKNPRRTWLQIRLDVLESDYPSDVAGVAIPYYETGLKIMTEQKAEINLKPHRVLPRWNYTIKPREGAHKMEK